MLMMMQMTMVQNNMMSKILQLNSRGWTTKKELIVQLIHELSPQIICMQETWTQKDTLPRVPAYHSYGINRQNRLGGGVAILVSNHICSKVIRYDTGNDIEIVSVEVIINRTRIAVSNVYLAKPTFASIQCFDSHIAMLSEVYEHQFICGDFNTHHHHWSADTHVSTPVGHALNAAFNKSGLVLLNTPGLATWYSDSNACSSVIDLSLITRDLLKISSPVWTIADSAISDHCALVTELTLPNSSDKRVPSPPHITWHHMRDWADWTNACQQPLTEWLHDHKTSHSSLDDHVASFNSLILELAKRVIGEKRVFTTSKLWWHGDESLQALIKASRKARRIYQRTRRNADRIAANRARKMCQQALCKAKKASWDKLCERIGNAQDPKSFWSLFKKSCGSSMTPMPSLLTPDGPVVAAADKANVLNSHFVSVSKAPATRPPHVKQYLQHHRADFDRMAEMSSTGLNSDIIEDELHAQLLELAKHCNKSPGADRINTQMLIHGGEAMRQCLLFLFNLSYQQGTLPSAWKIAKVHPILKPDKDAADASSYRPISILSVVGKLLERVIHARLQKTAHEQSWFSPHQSAFRKGHSTLDHVTRLCSDIWNAFEKGETLTLVLLDIQKAFDTSWRDAIRTKLHKLGLRGNMLWWLDDFLNGRKQFTVVNNEESNLEAVDEGIPQGSVLSPLLFLLLIDDICSDVSGDKALFADDVAIWLSSSDEEDMDTKLTTDLARVYQWGRDTDFTFSTSKSTVTRFSKTGAMQLPVVMLGGNQLPVDPCPKYLGIKLDTSLSFKDHIDYITDKCSKRLPLLTRLCGQRMGIRCGQALNLYKLTIRPLMDYGSQLWAGQRQSLIKPLERIQRQALIAASGALSTTSLEALQVDCFVQPLDLRFGGNALKWYGKIQRLPRSHPLHIQTLQLQSFSTPHPHSFLHYVTHQPNFAQRTVLKETTPSVEPLCIAYDDNIPPPFEAGLEQDEFTEMEEALPIRHELLKPFRHLMFVDPCPTPPRPRTADDQADAQNWVASKMQEIRCTSNEYAICFTDASCVSRIGADHSTRNIASMAVCYISDTFADSFGVTAVISEQCNNNTAELFAVAQACSMFLLDERCQGQELHIFSDSMYTQDTLFGKNQPSSRTSLDALTFSLFCIWRIVRRGKRVYFHWIPGHCGIEHNESVDRHAKLSIEQFCTNRPADWSPLVRVPFGTWCSRVEHRITEEWQRRWESARAWTDFPKGEHLFSLQNIISRSSFKWSLPRRASSLLCRLRHGHCALNSFLCKFTATDSICPSCDLEEETVMHFLLHCPAYSSNRDELFNSLPFQRPEDDTQALMMLLGTHPNLPTRFKNPVLSQTATFISATRRFEAPVPVDVVEDELLD